MAVWQSGHAAACKAAYAGPIPASASKIIAQVAKQVDARDLKSLGGNTMPVRFRPWAPNTDFPSFRFLYYTYRHIHWYYGTTIYPYN